MNIKSNSKNNEELIEALNQFYQLKSKFEESINSYKKKIINNPLLSNREKRQEFIKFKPKCINCKRPSTKGTIFTINYIPYNKDTDVESYRKMKAQCGDIVNPCNLNIELNIGHCDSLESILNETQESLKINKNEIINLKNKLLFGVIDDNTIINDMDFYKDNINELSELYGEYFDKLLGIIDNPSKNKELEESLILYYEYLNQIKDTMKLFYNTNDNRYSREVASIYMYQLNPLLIKIRHLKYNENSLIIENNCRLLQNKYNILDLLIEDSDNKVISNKIGAIINKKENLKKNLEEQIQEKRESIYYDDENDIMYGGLFKLKEGLINYN